MEKDEAKRQSYFDGEIHKCPSCGEVLNAFDIKCSHCGYELRNAKVSSTLVHFIEKLEKTKNEEEKIFIIKNFLIPNTKEDIIEFMMLASSNFDANYYASHLNEEDITDAWLVKIEQCYQKAKFFFNDDDLNQIKEIYQQTNQLINEQKKRKKQEEQAPLKKRIISISLVIALVIVSVVLIVSLFTPKPEPKIEISLDYTDEEFALLSVTEAENYLIGKGFNYIETEMKDATGLNVEEYDVCSVTIDGKIDFTPLDKFEGDDKIVITYYRYPILINVSSNALAKKDYKEVEALFNSMGFSNIKTVAIKDLTLGWITKNGSVENVVINGNNFNIGDKFMPNASVVINYHTFKK